MNSALVCMLPPQLTMSRVLVERGVLYFSETLLNSLVSNQAAPSAIITALLEVCNTWCGPTHLHCFFRFLHRFFTMIQSPGSRSCSVSDGDGHPFSTC